MCVKKAGSREEWVGAGAVGGGGGGAEKKEADGETGATEGMRGKREGGEERERERKREEEEEEERRERNSIQRP